MPDKSLSVNVNIKSILRKLIASVYYYTGLHRIYHKGKIHILMYHRVLKDNDKLVLTAQPGMYVTESVFRKQMRYLSRHYRIVNFSELLEIWNNGNYSNKERYCVVTFDDGWLDNYLNAYPILKEYKIPATIFVTTSFIGTNRWYWPEKLSYLLVNRYKNILELKNKKYDVGDNDILKIIDAITSRRNCTIRELIDSATESLKKYSEQQIDDTLQKIFELSDLRIPEDRMVINWAEIKEMSDYNISFGSHTCNHKILTKITLNEAREELGSSIKALKETNINFIPVFCYPNGNYNKEIQNIVRDIGYVAAVTTRYGFECRMPLDKYAIKRIGVHNDISYTIPLFSFHLSGLRHGL